MFVEFFCRRATCLLAWIGLIVFVAHAAFNAWVAYRLNGWFSSFYDILGEAGSGYAADIDAQLLQFVWIVLPAVLGHPIFSIFNSYWGFSWRIALIQSYLQRTDVSRDAIEGMSQRVHEDTGRFERGILDAVAMFLNSTFTLIVFIPILIEAGQTTIENPFWQSEYWLLAVAAGTAFGGLLVSIVVGHPLVKLEVKNQVVEAALRKKLVELEGMPALVVGASSELIEELHFDQLRTSPPPPRQVEVLPFFSSNLKALQFNYLRLFKWFFAFNSWSGFFAQATTLLPFILVAPMVVVQGITLGSLMSVTHAFDKVFGSFAALGFNWSAINDFRSVWRRLHEFERSLVTTEYLLSSEVEIIE